MLALQLLMVTAVAAHLHPHARSKRSDKEEAEVEHLKEELEERFSEQEVANMTEEERDYHYFRLHDFDNNDLLDGLEVFKALIHEHEDGNNQDTGNEGVKKSFDDIVEMIDQVLEEDDADKDGFLSYSEFVAGRRRALRDNNSEF